MSDDRITSGDVLEIIKPFRARIETRLEEVVAGFDGPRRLIEAMRYALLGPGKRVRPVLVLATCEALGGTEYDAWQAACAVEMVHAYSLVHDDLPAIDDDDERRGRPTVHRQFDEATAVLAGDALLTEAFALLSKDTSSVAAPNVLRMIQCLAAASGEAGMVGGQMIDIHGRDADADDLRRLHALKTGAVFRASCELGAIAASVPQGVEERVRKFGEIYGAAFQVSDDVLDLDEVDANTHEAEVNFAAREGAAAAAAELKRLGAEGHTILNDLDPTRTAFEVHRALLDWNVQRGTLPSAM